MEAPVLSPRENNRALAERLWRSARGVTFVARRPDGSPADPDGLARNPFGQMMVAPDGVLAAAVGGHAFAISIAEPDAAQVLTALDGDALGVRAPGGSESAFVFRGSAPRVVRKGVRVVTNIVAPGMQTPDGGEWEAIGSDLLGRLGGPRSDALPALPPWLANWFAGGELVAAEAEPTASVVAAKPGTCAGCRHFDAGASECRREPPGGVVDRAGNVMVDGWLRSTPQDWCRYFAPPDEAVRACSGCRWFASHRYAPGALGTCRAVGLRAPTDNRGAPTSRDGGWPSVSPKAWCGAHEPAAEGTGRAA